MGTADIENSSERESARTHYRASRHLELGKPVTICSLCPRANDRGRRGVAVIHSSQQYGYKIVFFICFVFDEGLRNVRKKPPKGKRAEEIEILRHHRHDHSVRGQ